MSGMQQLDQLLNATKTKALECIRYLGEYIFEQLPPQSKARAPMVPRL